MHLGAFSVSHAVSDIAASRAFYEKLGFSEAGGDQDQGWLILRSGATTIGLFQGMFDKNLLTFNPGWGPMAEPLAEPYEDVRAIQERLKAEGMVLIEETDPDGSGPGYITLEDPDGNPILIDQHV
ncbi:VOC family protein [Maritimibacter sp. HL-12]|uniref:VOC family protein n=1 Tax=Maritimibacter sp. HL-12 TaxID=1162418 RepID=UPI000A0F1436|nr:VOC family protein [Maritimibacter sp. HL-12]SMH51678.1 Glyoxalase-like domain-containing protein [Maritimibacter sp. HL-12]